MNVASLLRGVAYAGAIMFGFAGVAAAEEYPTRTIQIICPSGAGGGSDSLNRLVARELESLAGKSVIVVNKPGGGGLIGIRELINSKPDGYTLFVHASTAVVGGAYIAHQAGYTPVKDMAPIAPVTRIGWAVVVGKNSPVKSVSDLIKLIKEKNGKATYSSPNNATAAATALFEKKVGAKAVRVNYKAVVPAIMDVAAGEVDFTFADIALAVAQAKTGRIRILAVTTPERATVDKSYPTMSEVGVPGFVYTSFFGMWAPAGTPKPIVDKLNGWMQKIGENPKVQEAIVRMGFDPITGTSEELAKMVAEDSERWAELIEAGVIKKQ